MNLRWLFGNFTDPQYKLTRRDQFRLSSKAHESYLSTGKFLIWTSLVVLPPLLVAIVLIKPFQNWLGYSGNSMVHIAILSALILVFWPWSAWMYRYLYRKPIRKAMQEAGYELCIECGYHLKGLPPTIERCPECGTERTPIPEQEVSESK